MITEKDYLEAKRLIAEYELNIVSKPADNLVLHSDVVRFFDNNLATFREWLKDAKTEKEQEIHIRFCDATSFLKMMWLGRTIGK